MELNFDIHHEEEISTTATLSPSSPSLCCITNFKDRLSKLEQLQKKNSILFNRLSDELYELNEQFQSSSMNIPFHNDIDMNLKHRPAITSNAFKIKEHGNVYPMEIDKSTIIIGPNGTKMNKNLFDALTWSSASAATRKILSIIFDTKTLATHSLTGKPSPAFYGRERPSKNQLDPKIISDIIHLITVMCNASEKEIRTAITTKCADTTKRYKQQYMHQQEEN